MSEIVYRISDKVKLEGLRRFGEQIKGWALRCPNCRHALSVRDFQNHKDVPPLKTIHGLACSVAVVKNALATHLISTDEAINVLWDLVNEASPRQDVHYIQGTSAVIDRLFDRVRSNLTSIHIGNAHAVKKALIRTKGYRVGQPSSLQLTCDCGRKVPIEKPESEHTMRDIATGNLSRYACACGVIYDCRGWLVGADVVGMKPRGRRHV